MTPVVPRAGAPGPLGRMARIGDVLVGQGPPAHAPRYHVVLDKGLQEVAPLAADVLAAASGRAVTEVGAEVVAELPVLRRLVLAGWPVAGAGSARTGRGDGDLLDLVRRAWGGPGRWRAPRGRCRPPVRSSRSRARTVPDRRWSGVAVGAGGAVRATAPGVPAGAGTVWLVSASGVAYGVADEATAAALGIAEPVPAPEAVLRLLPTGPVLDVGQAARAVDVAVGGVGGGRRSEVGAEPGARRSEEATAAVTPSSVARATSGHTATGARAGAGGPTRP